jgi:uncharacterized protein YjiS (DUF1127 family)
MERAMTRAVVSSIFATGEASRWWTLSRALHRAMIAASTRRALNALPDDLLRDNGLTRADIAFVAETVAAGECDPTRDPLDRINRSVTDR